jgi:hypothetical protein
LKRIRAKPTKYCGIRFRSQLEAKYTTLFNMFDEPWTYESRFFKLPTANYLPDFFMQRLDVWIEVKGLEPNKREQQLCAELSAETGKDVLVAYGWPPPDNPYKTGLWIFSNGKLQAKGLYWVFDTDAQKLVIRHPFKSSLCSCVHIDEKIFRSIDDKFKKRIRPPAPKKR